MKKTLSLLFVLVALLIQANAQTSVNLGNPSDADLTNKDGWSSNMIVNLGDHIYTNQSGGVQEIQIDSFKFYVHDEARNPVTPFIVKYPNADSAKPTTAYIPEVIAIGTTRDSGDYVISQENIFSFNDTEDPLITLENGEVLAIGFMDANPDGTGGGLRSVIPWSPGGVPIFYGGGGTDTNSVSITLNEKVDTTGPGSGGTIFHLSRTYAFNMDITLLHEITSDTLGNSSDADLSNKDGWSSNMIVNLGDKIHLNNTGEVQEIQINSFNFYVHDEARNPVTPFIVKYPNADSAKPATAYIPEVIAIGTTRDSGDYVISQENIFAFSDIEAPTVTLENGEVLAIGFMDANPDGTGGGLRSVIPWNAGGVPIFYGGGGTDTNSVSITLNEKVDTTGPGSGGTIFHLSRTYAFNMGVTVKSKILPSTETDITGFVLAEQTGDATIDAEAHTVSIEVEKGTDPSALSPIITISEGASISPASGEAQDFSGDVTYTVTAEDGTTKQDWMVTVTVVPSSKETDITSFSLAEQTGSATLDADAHTVSIEVASGTDLTALTPTIEVSEGANISPASGEAQNFSSDVTYTVTAEDGTTKQDWTVSVSVATGIFATNTIELKIFPNPASDVVNIDFTELTGSISVSIISSNGVVVYQHNDVNNNELNISDLNSGIYIIKVQDNSRTLQQRLLVK